MIYYINGMLTIISNDYIVIEANGIGYQVFVPLTILSSLPKVSSNVKIFIHQHIREDQQLLFGFSSVDEKQFFSLLITVSGVGPKAGIKMLSHLNSSQLIEAILKEDLATLVSVPGVGKKMAEKIIIELKDRISKTLGADLAHLSSSQPDSNLRQIKDDISNALKSLGYRDEEIKKALLKSTQTLSSASNLEEGVKTVLKNI
ncbi:Holliday junction branch migration protein RuvA [Candidatus Margulisiibacteriota bacterium]